MAGAKETPRQKLISLMYLVFITMLALNVGKEVLDGFGQMFKKIESSNDRIEQSNDTYYEKINTNSLEKEGKWVGHNRTAQEIKTESDVFFNKIEDIKTKITEKQRIKDTLLTKYSEMDKGDQLNKIWFNSSGVSPEGDEFIQLMKGYKSHVFNVFSSKYPVYIEMVENRFTTGDPLEGKEDQVYNSDGTTQPWLAYNYENFPLISSLAKLTMMQSDIRATEHDVLQTLLGKELELESGVNESNYISLLKTEKGAYYQGETFDGSVILGRKGGAQNPNSVDLTIDGKKLNEGDYELIPGGVKLNITTGSPGDHEILGNLVFLNDGVESKISVKQSFPVIAKPSSAVISADKMNVVYRGIPNPMTISIAGIADNKITARAPGLRKVRGSKYVMIPQKGFDVSIRASATLPDGQSVSTSTKYRIKDIPAPAASVKGSVGRTSLGKNEFGKVTFKAVIPDFDFDIDLEVISFEIGVQGKAPVPVRGNKLNAGAISTIKSARKGQTVEIYNMKVRNPKNPKYLFKRVQGLVIKIR